LPERQSATWLRVPFCQAIPANPLKSLAARRLLTRLAMRKLVALFILGAPTLAFADDAGKHNVQIDIADTSKEHKEASRFVIAVGPANQMATLTTHVLDTTYEIGVRLDPNTHAYDVNLKRKGATLPDLTVFVSSTGLGGEPTVLEHSDIGGVVTEVSARVK
jgi:hypothetical protein